MKKLLIASFVVCGLLFSLSGSVKAQTGVRFGIKAGGSLNFSKINLGNLSMNGDSRFGFFGGGLMEISPSSPLNKFKVQLEALYSRVNIQISGSSDASGGKARVGVNQINLPVLAEYFLLPELSVNLGPTFNFNLNGKAKLVDSAGEVTDAGDLEDYKTVQIGLAAGATYYIHKGFFVDARYTPIFGNLNKDVEGSDGSGIKISAVKVGIGYKF